MKEITQYNLQLDYSGKCDHHSERVSWIETLSSGEYKEGETLPVRYVKSVTIDLKITIYIIVFTT